MLDWKWDEQLGQFSTETKTCLTSGKYFSTFLRKDQLLIEMQITFRNKIIFGFVFVFVKVKIVIYYKGVCYSKLSSWLQDNLV